MISALRNNLFVSQIILTLLSLAILICSSCSKNQEQDSATVEQALAPGDCLHPNVADGTLKQSSEIRTFVGDSLWEYINGGAEIYHQYGFEIVATADYTYGSEELVADIYRFRGSDGAFGLYASMRPENPTTDNLGVQGFVSSSNTTFVKGRFVVQLTAYSASDSASAGRSLLAASLASCLPGTTAPPETFTLLPFDSALVNSEQVFALSYQGRSFLNDFYTRKYSLNGDTVTMFISTQDAADKFEQWIAAVSADQELAASATDLPFSDGTMVVTETYYGPMLFGLNRSHLIGMINYSPKQVTFLRTWMMSGD